MRSAECACRSMKPGQSMSPSRVDDLARRRRAAPALGSCVTSSIVPPRDADVALERRRVARVDGGAADEEVEHGYAGGERPAERERRHRHPGAEEREDAAEAERAEQAGHEDDAARGSPPGRACRRRG